MTAPATGTDVIAQAIKLYPERMADVPLSVLRDLAELVDQALLDARIKGNTPRDPIAEDGKRGGRELPRR